MTVTIWSSAAPISVSTSNRFEPDRMADTRSETSMTTVPDFDVHPFTDRGRRDYQEDYFYTAPPARDGLPWLGVVADGMGGHLGGDIASKAGVHALKTSFETAVQARLRTEDALVKAVTTGHEAVLEAAEQAGALGNMGSTVIAFVIDGQTLHWCSAGDSRLYLYRADALLQLSRDFTLAEDMRKGVGAGNWTQDDIDKSPQRNALTSFMGTDKWRFHAESKRLQHGDVIIACSDGVYGTLGSEGMAAACRAAGAQPSSQRIADNLQSRLVAAGKPNQDNSTAIVVRFLATRPALGDYKPGARMGRGLVLLGGGALLTAALAAAGYMLFKPNPAGAPASAAARESAAQAAARPSNPAKPTGHGETSLAVPPPAASPPTTTSPVAMPPGNTGPASEPWSFELTQLRGLLDSGKAPPAQVVAAIRGLVLRCTDGGLDVKSQQRLLRDLADALQDRRGANPVQVKPVETAEVPVKKVESVKKNPKESGPLPRPGPNQEIAGMTRRAGPAERQAMPDEQAAIQAVPAPNPPSAANPAAGANPAALNNKAESGMPPTPGGNPPPGPPSGAK